MKKFFDGRKIRDEILARLKSRIDKMERVPGLAVICVGDNPVCSKYVSLKKKSADLIGVHFYDYNFGAQNTQEEVVARIEKLNDDDHVDGIMVQMPLPEKFDKFEIVHAIAPEKDVDGLRFCCAYKSSFKPPVVLAILEAIKQAGKVLNGEEVVVVGRGFLVGWPLAQCLEEAIKGLVVADENTKNLPEIIKNADIVISAVGKAGIILPEMVQDGAVLIDAGTTEVSGELLGDIAPSCYEKSSYYTPVPGGIGPVTIAKLFENLVG